MSLKCHFDADGWLVGPIRITHVLSPNHFASGFAVRACGMVQHTEDGFEAGTVATFMDAASKVSAFFSVGEDGTAHQYLPVGRGFVAWAEAGGNPEWYSTEYEDKTRTGDLMTHPQMLAGAQILEACSARDGFPLAATDDPENGRGLITHGDGGLAWGGHFGCPGPVRKSQRPQIIALAMSIRQGSAPQEGWTAAMIANLPTLQLGAEDKAGHVFFVHRLQALAVCYGRINSLTAAACLAGTGTFDGATVAAVKAIQAHKRLTQDGICGPQTWGVLIAGVPA